MKISLLLLLLSLNANALDCGGMTEGTEVRIDKNNGSLEDAPIQDQDGIGSCYANQASLMLKSILPTHPDLSYLNLGLFYTEAKKLVDNRKTGDKFFTKERRETIRVGDSETEVVKNEGGSAIWGGTSCATIELIKEKQKDNKFGGICNAKDINLEHQFFDPQIGSTLDGQHVQEKTIVAASKYMNVYQHKFGFSYDENKSSNEFRAKRKQADEFRDALSKFVEKSSDDFLVKKCTQPNPEKTAEILNSTLTKAFLNQKDCYDNRLRMKTDSAICKTYDKLGYVYGAVGDKDKPSKIMFSLNEPVKNKMNESVNKLFKPEGGFDGFLNGLDSNIAALDTTKNSAEQKAKFAKSFRDNLSPEDKNKLEAEYNRVALKQVDECKSEKMLEFFKDKDDFVDSAMQDPVLCKYGDLIQRASDMAGVLPAKTFNNMSNFLSFLTDKAGLDYDRGLLEFIGRDCTPEKRIKIPESISCKNELMSFSPEDFPGADGVSEKAARVIRDQRAKLMSNLNADKAIGVDVCTKFWNDATYDFHKENASTKNNTCQNSGDHGFHAITMIGYRCKDNRIQYMTQNSWGPNWKIKAGEYEHEPGKVWMDEDKLFKNLQGFDYISR